MVDGVEAVKSVASVGADTSDPKLDVPKIISLLDRLKCPSFHDCLCSSFNLHTVDVKISSPFYPYYERAPIKKKLVLNEY